MFALSVWQVKRLVRRSSKDIMSRLQDKRLPGNVSANHWHVQIYTCHRLNMNIDNSTEHVISPDRQSGDGAMERWRGGAADDKAAKHVSGLRRSLTLWNHQTLYLQPRLCRQNRNIKPKHNLFWTLTISCLCLIRTRQQAQCRHNLNRT